jgi:hypothetical protein
MIERRVEEEALVLDTEVLLGFANPPLTQGKKLFTLGERTDGDSPFFEGNWHEKT